MTTISRDEAAKALGVPVRSIDRLIGTGQLPVIRLGRSVGIDVAVANALAQAARWADTSIRSVAVAVVGRWDSADPPETICAPKRTWAGVDRSISGPSDPAWQEQLAAVYRWWPIGRDVDPRGAAMVIHTCGLVHDSLLGRIDEIEDEVWYGRGRRRVALRIGPATAAQRAAYGGPSRWVHSPRGPMVQYFGQGW